MNLNINYVSLEICPRYEFCVQGTIQTLSHNILFSEYEIMIGMVHSPPFRD